MFRFKKKYILFYFLFSILFGDVKFDEIVDLKVRKDRDSYRLGEFLKLTFEINVADNFCISVSKVSLILDPCLPF